MTVIANIDVVIGGLEPTYTAAAASQTFRAGDNRLLHVINADASPTTLTIETPRTDADGNAIADRAVVIPAGEERMIGPFPPHIYAAGSTDQVTISWSSVTAITFAVIRLP